MNFISFNNKHLNIDKIIQIYVYNQQNGKYKLTIVFGELEDSYDCETFETEVEAQEALNKLIEELKNYGK